jgi:hypothetical protein
VGSRRQGKRPGESRPGDGGSDSGVDGPAGGWEGVGNRGLGRQTCGRAVVVGGIGHGCSPCERGRRTASTPGPSGRACTGGCGFGQDRAGTGGGGSPRGFEYAGTGNGASATIDPRLVPLGIRETAFARRYRGVPAYLRRAAPGNGTSVRVERGSAGSSRWFFRDQALRRTALGPHAASRHGPATRWPAAGRWRTATRPQRHPTFVGVVVADCGRVGLPAAQERRLHVIRGYPTYGPPDWPFDEPIAGAASSRWRARGR